MIGHAFAHRAFLTIFLQAGYIVDENTVAVRRNALAGSRDEMGKGPACLNPNSLN